MTTSRTDLADALAVDREVAEELQDRLRRERQTARALRDYLLSKRVTEPSPPAPR